MLMLTVIRLRYYQNPTRIRYSFLSPPDWLDYTNNQAADWTEDVSLRQGAGFIYRKLVIAVL